MKLKNTIISMCVCGVGFLVLGGCQAGVSAQVGNPGVETTGATVQNDQAVRSITEARCNREVACNNIGAGQKYDDFAACTREIGHDTGVTLRDQKCPEGILQARLASCLDQISTERCGNPLDTVERLAACRKGMLCR
ncbi:MAG TPA: DUF6184 family natural product biosynthesis lipoprotein [Polyangiaceae bacterium]|jgi:hypothetical protein